MPLRVLTWNLMHGRSVPPAGRDLLPEFATALAGWDWDAALLQEVPPWWPEPLARRCGADQRLVLTSRNALLPLRRCVAVRWPDMIKSNGGGCNAILTRHQAITEHRSRRLSWRPERRWLHAARIESGTWLGNLHLTVHDEAAARTEAALAAVTMREWAAGAPVALGGDFNVRTLSLEDFQFAGGHDVDLVFVNQLAPGAQPDVLARGHLSDHAPVVIELR
jgi:endonuclease/exonuclease/phosphatase family metal-dependent hydrolase